MDNNLSGGYISNDNTLSGIIDINANSVTAQTITGVDGFFTNLNVQNLQIVGGDGALGISSWGSFWSLATQTNPTANAVNFMSFSNYDVCNNNVYFKPSSTNQIQVDLSGVYNIQFSAQTNITQGNNGKIYIWLLVNGVNVASTTGKENVSNANGLIISWNYILPLNAGDYIQLAWASSDVHMQLLYEAASGSPTKPAIPSVILTVQAVSTNLKGDKGDPGTNGTNGAKGDTGNPGTNGTAATITVNSTTTGVAGTPATVTNVGTSSAALLNFTIPQGIAGNAATVTVNSTTTGSSGTPANVVNVGTSSAALLNFTIPQGLKGDAATVTVNSTTTGFPGSGAYVTNSGTSSAALLDFVIPQGDQGNKGDKGEKGDKGDTGGGAAEGAAAGAAAGAVSGGLAGATSGAAAGASAGAEAGAAAGTAAAEAVVADLEPRLEVVETKTAYQTAFTDVGTNQHTQFDGIVEVNTNAGLKRIVLDGTEAGKILLGVSSGFQTEIQPSLVKTQALTASTLDSLDNTSQLNIGNTATKVIIGNKITVENNAINVQQTGSSGTQISTNSVSTQTINTDYIEPRTALGTLVIGQTASRIDIGNFITGTSGIPAINLYGKVNFDPTEICSSFIQFIT